MIFSFKIMEQKDFEVEDKENLTNQFYLEVKLKDDTFNIFYDDLINRYDKIFKEFNYYYIPGKYYISYYMEKQDIYYSLKFHNKSQTSFLFFKKKKNVKIEDKNGKIFEYKIYCEDHLVNLIEKHGLQDHYIILNPNGEKIKSEKIYDYDSINIKFTESKDFNIDEIFIRYNQSHDDPKENLTLNFDSYFKLNAPFSYIETKERKELEKKLGKFVQENKTKIFCLTGISGIGKSITLLHFLKEYNNLATCYFNVRELHKYQEEKLITQEAFKLFKRRQNDYKEVIKEANEKNYNNIWEKILFIIGKSPEPLKKIIVFDQYKISYDNNFFQILNISQKIQNVKIILCASINDDNLRDNIIESNWIKNIKNEGLFNFYYIEKNLANIEKNIENQPQLLNVMKNFSFSPKIYNKYLYNYDKIEEKEKEKILEEIMNSYSKNIKRFYINKRIHLYEKYRIICTYIQTEQLLNIQQFRDIIDFLPLKYIRIIKREDDFFIIDYAFPFLYYVFKKLYKEELKLFYNLNYINTNNNSQIGNFIDDLVNLKFDIAQKFGNNVIEKKIIIDRISGFKKFFKYIGKENYGSEFEIYFGDYFKIDKKNDINAELIFKDRKVIFIEQFFQGKDFDGGLLIPFKNIDGNFDLFLYQTSINKKNKFSRNYIYEQYNLIKKDLEDIFGIKIVNGYFSYILLFENPDVETKIHCEKYFINYFNYSINKNEFVESNGKKINEFLTIKSLIYESEEINDFSNFQKEFDFFKNCLMYNKKEIIPVDCPATKIYLKKKIKLYDESSDIISEKISTLKTKIEKNIDSINKLIKLNKILIEKIESENIKIDKTNNNLLQKESEIIKNSLDDNISFEDLQNKQSNYRKMLNNEKKKLNELKYILERENIDIRDILDNNIDEEKDDLFDKFNKDQLSYNVRDKIKQKKLPIFLSQHLTTYTHFTEIGNEFYLGLKVPYELPYCLIFNKRNETKYIYLIYFKNGEITKINLDKNRKFDEKDSNDFIYYQTTGSLSCHYWKLIIKKND